MPVKLNEGQLANFEEKGFLILPGLFSAAEVAVIKAALLPLFAEDVPANIVEKSSGVVRTAMGLHLRSEVFAKLVRHPRLVEPAMQVRGDELYVQQVKVNVKAAYTGEAWQWHEDFATHNGEDGVPNPLALNLHIFLDDVSQFNGPLYFIPGSHKYGPTKATLDTVTTSYPLWVLDREIVRDTADRHGIEAMTGPAGTGLIFVDDLIHGSPNNMSPWDRAIFSLILNPVANAMIKSDRPDHKHHRDFSPVVPLTDDCLGV